MSLPIRKDQEPNPEDLTEAINVLTNLTNQFFTGEDAEILKNMLAHNSFKSTEAFFEAVFGKVAERVDISSLNNTEIEEHDLLNIGKDIANLFEPKEFSEIKPEDAVKFESSLKKFVYFTLHKVAFPMMVLENPNIALSAKNLLKRTIAAAQQEEGVDLSEVYEELKIEELPTEFDQELFLELGGKIPGITEPLYEIIDSEVTDPKLFHTEMSEVHAVYLAYTLKNDYFVFKNWKPFFNLLKSNGKKYDNVIVYNDKIGLLLCVLSELYERKTTMGTRYVYVSKTNGIWTFFEQYLIDSKTDQLFSELRKITRKEYEEKAIEIVNFLFNPANQNNINNVVNSLVKK